MLIRLLYHDFALSCLWCCTADRTPTSSSVCLLSYGDPRELHALPHSFPTRRSSDLFSQPHQIVDHLDDAASGQAEIDAALEVVPCRIAEDRGELAFAPRLPLMDPGHRLAQFAHRIIGILDMHADRRVGEHAAGRAVLIVEIGRAHV